MEVARADQNWGTGHTTLLYRYSEAMKATSASESARARFKGRASSMRAIVVDVTADEPVPIMIDGTDSGGYPQCTFAAG